MGRLLRSVLAIATAVAWLPAAAAAQGTSTATIAGVVRDSSGAVLPGVTVEAASPALIEKVRSTVTDERGEYRLPELRPGHLHGHVHAAGLRHAQARRPRAAHQLHRADRRGADGQPARRRPSRSPVPRRSWTCRAATQQRTVTREVLDTVPTAKSVLGIAALIPAVVEPPNAQDVGGSKGERSVRITVHGGKTFDSRLLQDGMRYNALTPGHRQPRRHRPRLLRQPARPCRKSWSTSARWARPSTRWAARR